MSGTHNDRSFSFFHSYGNLPWKSTSIFLISCLILIFSSCTNFIRVQKPVASISRIDKENIISLMKTQGNIAARFYFSGKIIVDGWILDSTANIFIAGEKDPFKLKIEITHSWGKPIIHLLAKGNRLEVVDFGEKKQFIGELNPDNFSKFFPDLDISPSIIWSFLRGYPELVSYTGIEENRSGAIILKDGRKKIIEHVKYSAEKGNVEAITFSTDSLNIDYNNFRAKGDIYYAEKTMLKGTNVKGSRAMTIVRENMFFNREIPDEIFTLKKPPSYEVFHFEEM